MPKGKIDVLKGTLRIRKNVSQKFKIGSRKSTNSALCMSNVALRDVVTKGGKDAQTARNELTRRGAALVTEEKEKSAV